MTWEEETINVLREALEAVQWAGDTGGEVVLDYYCDLCGNWKDQGHDPLCLVGRALRRDNKNKKD